MKDMAKKEFLTTTMMFVTNCKFAIKNYINFV
jgi:hypothetical protein